MRTLWLIGTHESDMLESRGKKEQEAGVMAAATADEGELLL